MENQGSTKRWLKALCVGAVMGGLYASSAKAADDLPLSGREFCRLAGGTYTDLGSGRSRCCLANWGCYVCNGGDNCDFECTTRRCCVANDISSDSHCWIIYAVAEVDGSVDGNQDGPMNADLHGDLADAVLVSDADMDHFTDHEALLLEQIDLLEAAEAGLLEEDQPVDTDGDNHVREVQLCGAGMLFPMMLGVMGVGLVRRRSAASGRPE